MKKSKTYPEFAPDEEELLELAKYWIKSALEIETFWFLAATTSSFDRNTKAYANKRLDRIAEIVGDESVKKVITEVENVFRRRLGDAKWEIFQNGSEEEWDKVRRRSFEAEKDSPAAPGYAVAYLKTQAVKMFPDVPGEDLATALRFAADDVEAGQVVVEPCSHDWQIPPEDRVSGPTVGGFIYAFQRCSKCQAIREHRFYPGDPGYEDAYERTQEYR